MNSDKLAYGATLYGIAYDFMLKRAYFVLLFVLQITDKTSCNSHS